MILNLRIFFVVTVVLSLASLPTFGQNAAPKAMVISTVWPTSGWISSSAMEMK